MSTILVIALVSYVTVLVSGFPMSVAPPEHMVEKFNDTGMNLQKIGASFAYDMIPTPGSSRKGLLRGVAVQKKNRWPNGDVPYDISAITNSHHRDLITHAMHAIMYDTGSAIAGSFNRHACVYFRPRIPSDETYLTIRTGQGCNAHLGYYPKFKLTMTLDTDCYTGGVIQHELMHVLGFDHEQNRPDRDNYVDIYLENIIDEFQFAFKKQSKDETTNLNTPYDYNSIMHYGNHFFSKNGKPTVVAKQQNIQIPGHLPALSPIDIEEVRRFYECAA